MSNYQTDFLNALSITSQSLSGLMRDIREPDFQERVKIEEQSQMRLNQQLQDFKMEELEDRQDFRLTEMDEGQKDFLERISTQGIVTTKSTNAINEYNQGLNERDKKFDEEMRQARRDNDTEWFANNAKKIADSQTKFQKFLDENNYDYEKGRFFGNLIFDASRGFFAPEGAGMQRKRQQLGAREYDFETGNMVRRGDTLFDQRRNQEEVLKAIYEASGVSPQFQEEHSSTQQGFNALYGGLNMQDPASMLAARNLLNMQNDGLYAQMVVDNQKGFAMRNVLQSGATPEFDINEIVGNVSKNTKRDRFFGRSPEQRMELATATKNAYSSSLGLATMQAQYALEDKFGGINRSRQKEALKDLIEAKTLAERLMKDTKFGSTSKENIENYKQYYGDSIKMLNTWIQALQR
tara:strand:+ start:7929 stop:9152 length:1224 start_codon:yes stop_codon:yes gene_type:complete